MKRTELLGLVSASAVAIPVYLHIAPPFASLAGTSLSSIDASNPGFHWSLLVGPVLCIVLLARPWPASPSRVLWPLAVLAYWLSVVALAAVVVSPIARVDSLVFLGQLLIPATFVVVGRRLGSSGMTSKCIRDFAVLILLYQAVFLVSNIDSIVAPNARDISVRFPQYQTYYPILLALGVSALWGRFNSIVVRVLFSLSVLAILPTIWSRSGVIALSVAVVVGGIGWWVVANRGLASPIRSTVIGPLRLAAVAGIVAAIGFAALQGEVGERLQDRSERGQALFSSGRGELVAGAVWRIANSPVWGDAGQPAFDRADFGGTSGLGWRLYPAHNQLLDIGLRGGVPAMALAVVAIGSLSAWAIASLRRRRSADWTVVVAALAVAVSSSLTDLPFSQAITASPIWFLIGLLHGQDSVPKHRTTEAESEILGAPN